MDSFIGWIGGKKLLRKQIISMFPAEMPERYIEVFGGAGWVLFGKEPSKFEVYNDADGELVNLFRCSKHHPEALVKELESTLQAREIFVDYKHQINVRGLTDIQRAARLLYLIKNSFGSDLSSFATFPKNISSALSKLDDIKNRLSRVIVENLDFEKLIKTYDRTDALFYLDPPYHGAERYYEACFTEQDHYRLCNVLKGIKGKFVLSYNDDEFVRGLYKDFNITEVSRTNSLSSKKGREYKELIIKNY